MRKILALGLGLVISLFVLEFSIRGMTFFLERNQSDLNQKSDFKGKKTITVFTLGESTTSLAGNDSNKMLIQANSYPFVLERILNEGSSDLKFKVYNLGITGGTTENVIHKLREESKKIRPDIIVTMMGMKDNQNTKKAIEEKTVFSIKAFFYFLAEHSKIINWIKVYLAEREHLENIQRDSSFDLNAPKSSSMLSSQIEYNSRKFIFEELDGKLENVKYLEVMNKYYKINYLINVGEYQNAINLLKEMIKKNGIGHFVLFHNYLMMNDQQNAELTMLNFLKENPRNGYGYANLLSIYRSQNNQKKFESTLNKVQTVKLINNRSFSVDMEYIQYLNEQNRIKEAKVICEKYLTDYPFLSKEDYLKRKKERGDKLKFSDPDLKINYQINANFEELRFHLLVSEVLINDKNYSEAEKHIQYYAKLNGGNTGLATMLLRRIYQISGNNEKEYNILQTVLEKSYRVADIYELGEFLKKNSKMSDTHNVYQVIQKILPGTIYNFHELYSISQQMRSALILMQYPTFSSDILSYFIKEPKILYLSNEFIFNDAPKSEYLYEPRFPYKYNHYTKKGAEVLAANVARFIKEKIQSGQIRLE